jgi:hypothetical protein
MRHIYLRKPPRLPKKVYTTALCESRLSAPLAKEIGVRGFLKKKKEKRENSVLRRIQPLDPPNIDITALQMIG